MKKLAAFLAAMILLMLTACAQERETVGIPDNTSIPSESNNFSMIQPMQPPTQPIMFDNNDAMLQFLKFPDLSVYYEDFVEDYEIMIDAINRDGFLYEPHSSIASRDIESVCLYPRVSHEDIGVGYYLTYLDKLFRVYVYAVTDDESVVFTSKDLPSYWSARMGSDIFNEFDVNVDGIETFVYEVDDFLVIGGFLDSTHYFIVRTNANRDELVQFADSLVFDTIELN